MAIQIRRVPRDSSEFGVRLSDDTSNVDYVLTGTTDRIAAETYALANIPVADAHRLFEKLSVKEVRDHRDGQFILTAKYKGPTIKVKEQPDPDPSPTIDEISVAFDLTAQTKTYTQSLATIASYYAPNETTPDFKKLINIVDGYPEGVEINPASIAESSFTVEQEVPRVLITNTWLKEKKAFIGKLANGAFRGHSTGEVMFGGLRGTVKHDEPIIALSWEFLTIENQPAKDIGVFEDVVKKGWEYAWVYSEERVVTTGSKKTLTHAPVAMYVEQLFEYVDFSTIGVVA